MVHAFGAFIALVLFAPIFWMALDRDNPVERLHGELLPQKVARGGFVAVKYWTKKRTRSDCAGAVQQEIVDSQNTIYQKLARAVGPALWENDPDNPNQEIFYGHQVSIPIQAAPGPAVFRTTTFRYCNWLHRVAQWPIVQIGPDLPFMITEEVLDPRRKPN